MQTFFLPEGILKPERSLATAEIAAKAYTRWGFIETESLLPLKNSTASTTELSLTQRRQILERLLKTHTSLTVSDYLEACQHRIHRRTAERDLRSCIVLRPSGSTRAREYRVQKN